MRFKTAPHVAWQQLDDQVILVDLRSGVGMGLNPAATLIWKLLERAELAEIVSSLAHEFEISADDAARDVDEFVSELAGKNLISRLDV